jgi:hypothetical protein
MDKHVGYRAKLFSTRFEQNPVWRNSRSNLAPATAQGNAVRAIEKRTRRPITERSDRGFHPAERLFTSSQDFVLLLRDLTIERLGRLTIAIAANQAKRDVLS